MLDELVTLAPVNTLRCNDKNIKYMLAVCQWAYYFYFLYLSEQLTNSKNSLDIKLLERHLSKKLTKSEKSELEDIKIEITSTLEQPTEIRYKKEISDIPKRTINNVKRGEQLNTNIISVEDGLSLNLEADIISSFDLLKANLSLEEASSTEDLRLSSINIAHAFSNALTNYTVGYELENEVNEKYNYTRHLKDLTYTDMFKKIITHFDLSLTYYDALNQLDLRASNKAEESEDTSEYDDLCKPKNEDSSIYIGGIDDRKRAHVAMTYVISRVMLWPSQDDLNSSDIFKIEVNGDKYGLFVKDAMWQNLTFVRQADRTAGLLQNPDKNIGSTSRLFLPRGYIGRRERKNSINISGELKVHSWLDQIWYDVDKKEVVIDGQNFTPGTQMLNPTSFGDIETLEGEYINPTNYNSELVLKTPHLVIYRYTKISDSTFSSETILGTALPFDMFVTRTNFLDYVSECVDNTGIQNDKNWSLYYTYCPTTNSLYTTFVHSGNGDDRFYKAVPISITYGHYSSSQTSRAWNFIALRSNSTTRDILNDSMFKFLPGNPFDDYLTLGNLQTINGTTLFTDTEVVSFMGKNKKYIDMFTCDAMCQLQININNTGTPFKYMLDDVAICSFNAYKEKDIRSTYKVQTNECYDNNIPIIKLINLKRTTNGLSREILELSDRISIPGDVEISPISLPYTVQPGQHSCSSMGASIVRNSEYMKLIDVNQTSKDINYDTFVSQYSHIPVSPVASICKYLMGSIHTEEINFPKKEMEDNAMLYNYTQEGTRPLFECFRPALLLAYLSEDTENILDALPKVIRLLPGNDINRLIGTDGPMADKFKDVWLELPKYIDKELKNARN